jgi:hypothetical protein
MKGGSDEKQLPGYNIYRTTPKILPFRFKALWLVTTTIEFQHFSNNRARNVACNIDLQHLRQVDGKRSNFKMFKCCNAATKTK